MRRSLLLFLPFLCAFTWTDEPLTPYVSVPRAVHQSELRTNVDFIRSIYGFAPATYTNPANSGDAVSATDINEVRQSFIDLFNAYGGAGGDKSGCIFYFGFTDFPSIGALDGTGTVIKATHVEELRHDLDSTNQNCDDNTQNSCCSVCGYCDGTNGCQPLPAGSACVLGIIGGTCDGLGYGEPHCI